MTPDQAIPFDTDDPEFARGVEIGRLWQRLIFHAFAFEMPMHTANAEMVIRCAEATGRHIEAERIDDTWMTIRVAAR